MSKTSTAAKVLPNKNLDNVLLGQKSRQVKASQMSSISSTTNDLSSSSVLSAKFLRDRTHLTLDFKEMKPRSNNTKSTMPADSTISPLSLPRDLLDSIMLSPEKILQLPPTWKTAVASGITQYQVQLQNSYSSALTTIAETPTPTKFIYPKNVTKQQENFAEGFQKALQKIQSDNKFAPLQTSIKPSCSPSTIKYLLSLLTPISVPKQQQQQQQQQQQTVSSLLLSSPSSIALFNLPLQPPPTNLNNTITSLATLNNNSEIVSSSTTVTLSFLNNKDTNYDEVNFLTNLHPEKRKLQSNNNFSDLLFSSLPASTSHQTFQSTNAAVVAAVAAVVAAVSPTTEPLLKTSRLSINNSISTLVPLSKTTVSATSPTTAASAVRNTNSLFNNLSKLDPNNSRFMEFRHQQQLSSSNFAPSFVASNDTMVDNNQNSRTLSLPLNFAQTSSLSLANMAAANQQQHILLGSQSQTQQQQPSPQSIQQHMLLPQQQHMLIKQENMNNFLHEALQQSSMEASVSTQNNLVSQQSSTDNRRDNHQRSLSSASNSSSIMLGAYGNLNLPFDQDQERKKLERKRARNRMAASKCRQRKLERINELEDQVKMFKEEGAMLQNQIIHLKQEVIDLNEMIDQHHTAGCSINVPFKVSNI